MLRSVDLRQRLAGDFDDLLVLTADPDHAVQHALTFEHLPGRQPKYVAGLILDIFQTFEAELISPECVFGENERLYLAKVSEILFGQPDPFETVVRPADELFDALT